MSLWLPAPPSTPPQSLLCLSWSGGQPVPSCRGPSIYSSSGPGSTGQQSTPGRACRRTQSVMAAAAAPRAPAEAVGPRETHKIFDEVSIVVRSGSGGAGEVLRDARRRTVPNFKYKPGGNAPKTISLPPGDPAPGTDGAHVILYVDPALDSLLHLHGGGKKVRAGRDGTGGNPAEGSGGPLSRDRLRRRMPSLRIGVPPGTVVKRGAGGRLLGELLSPGDELVVARGGRGGAGVVAPSAQPQRRQQAGQRRARGGAAAVVEEVIVEDEDWKVDSRGAPGEEVKLHLVMRVVADVGIVGLPNAGKSSLLAALTRARPEVAAYPFTTLMPNLGVLRSGGDDALHDYGGNGAGGSVLADMPGLIQGAHEGRGLGRMFLRHLRRTRVILHVVDAAAPDPAADYWAVREELRMYNPEYCARPHVVALNKMDLEDAAELQEEVQAEVLGIAARLRDEHGVGITLPAAVVCISAKDGTGVQGVSAALEPLLSDYGDYDVY